MEKEKINVTLTFSEVLDKTAQFVEGIISPEEFAEWGNNFTIQAALPILDKLSLLMTLIEKKEYSAVESQEVLVCELYRNIFFYVYLGGYLGVKDIKSEDVTYANYDLLEPIFGPWIESFAERDIAIFKNMLRDSINFYDIIDMHKAVNAIDHKALSKATNSNKELIEYINQNKDLVKDLKDLTIMNNPLTYKVVESIKDAALK